jgi:precorrin-2/cobalt-factor-2 C20-methyltransferase
VRKSSIYLPERLKEALSARAAQTGASEAELIRNSLESALAASPAQLPDLPDRPVPGRLVGVGVGPGDPDLVTVRALAALHRADRVLAPTSAVDAVGRAEAIVRVAAPRIRVERVPFAMVADRGSRARSVHGAADVVAGLLARGCEVAWITLGDPLVYSTFPAVAASVSRRRPSTTVEHVPGIMAFQALASRTGTVVAADRTRLTIRTALDGDDLTADLDDPGSTVVVYKGGRRLPELASLAAKQGRSASAVAGELLGMTGERVGTLDELADQGPASYLATVILPSPAGTLSGVDR